MQYRPQPNGITLVFNSAERQFLSRILKSLVAHYQLPPDQLDAATAEAWYSTRGCVSARMSADETRDWIRHLHELKGNRRRLLERCLTTLKGKLPDPVELYLRREEAGELMTALNDHRLWLAARHDLGEREMTRGFLEESEELTPGPALALIEIHMLAGLVERLIAFIAPEAAAWQEELPDSPEESD